MGSAPPKYVVNIARYHTRYKTNKYTVYTMASMKRKFAFIRKRDRSSDEKLESTDDELVPVDVQEMPVVDEEFKELRDRMVKDRENSQVSLHLGGSRMFFDGSEWMNEDEASETTLYDQLVKLREDLTEIKDENNMLKIKVHLLMNMLADKQSELNELRGENPTTKDVQGDSDTDRAESVESFIYN